MWTPKRILLVFGGFVLFFAGFVVYTHFLGNINGWPQLPGPLEEPFTVVGEVLPPTETGIVKKLQMAFGEGCKEINRPIRLELPGRGLIVASDEISFEPDGRVKLRPFSMAIFGKERGDGSYPDINSVRSTEALLRFDQPISSITDMGSRKIMGAELAPAVTIINNRRTAQKSDDIEVHIAVSPLFYDDKLNKVWSDGFVKLLDTQAQPEPTTITGKGMELYLVKETRPAPAAGGAGKGKTESGTGVERIVLLSNVDMHLHTAGQSGFLGGADKSEKKPEQGGQKNDPKEPPQPSHIIIRTEGQFIYDMPKDIADFESPPASATPGSSLAPPQVLVTREHIEGKGKLYDQLTCDHLRLQFRRKSVSDPQGPRDNSLGGDREIESAHATSGTGKEVVLSMDSEHLDSHGNELLYYSATANKGSETILRGSPMHAVKDAHKIEAFEMRLLGPNAKGEGQQATAKGPGKIDLLDHNSNPKVPSYPFHTRWRDTMVVTKDREGEKTYDLLTFTGDAAFIDDEHGQELHAEKLQLWLDQPERQETVEVEQEKNKLSTGPGAPRQQPHKLIGYEHVTARSPELRILEAEYLIVRFKNVAGAGLGRLPEPLPPALDGSALPPADKNGTPPPTGKSGDPQPLLKQTPGSPLAQSGPGGAEADKKDRKPIDLRARRVSLEVLRTGEKNELDEVITEGATHVHQEGATPQDKGVDIQGETLKLKHFAEGDILTVWGSDLTSPAQLQLGELFLVGPRVTINQKDNTADVAGVGAMHMPSNTTFEGDTPKKPGTRLTVHWTETMFFNGTEAVFNGNVVAYQENASVRCQAMQVALDKMVSFKEGQKSGQGAKVEKLVCDKKVYIADCARDDAGALVRYQRLIGLLLSMDNKDGPVIATGPGKVYLFQPGSLETIDPNSQPPQQPAAIKPAQAKSATPQPFYLTRVDFQGRMFSNNKEKTRTAKFYDNVEVYHLPAENPDVKVDADHLPKGGIYLRCERLTTYSKPMPDGKTAQYMRGEQNVSFRTPEFHGTSIMVKYDQLQDQVIFDGVTGSPVRLFRLSPQRGEPDMITGYHILYYRKTGVMMVDGGKEFRINTQ